MSSGNSTDSGLNPRDLMSASVVTNYDIDATAGGLWTSTTVYQVTVPAGYAYYCYGGIIARSAAQTAITDVYDGTNIVLRLGSLAAATTVLNYPDTNAGNLCLPVKLPAGYFVRTTYGGAQGAAAYESCYVLKVKV